MWPDTVNSVQCSVDLVKFYSEHNRKSLVRHLNRTGVTLHHSHIDTNIFGTCDNMYIYEVWSCNFYQFNVASKDIYLTSSYLYLDLL